ncbi:MAG: hypothetical protein Q4F84_01460, partial [Fibrobacter sp.]|nr:hypothetical protein [Fibrobacter sp.]
GTKSDMRSDFSNMSGNGKVISSLFLPGYQQFKAGKKGKGTVMVSLAGGSIAWCIADGAANKRFNALPICFLAADMIWSFIDYKVANK